jgi:serine O-acetyltransferase
MGLLNLIRSDYRKYRNYGSHFLVIVFFTQGFWAIFQYRVAHRIHTAVKWQPFRGFFLFFIFIWQKWIEILTGIVIPMSAKIGPGFHISHCGGIILNSNAVIGSNCNISQGVTIGVSGAGSGRGVPVIGNDVYIGANAVVAGKITIGDNVLIAACSLVNADVAEGSVVLGVPAVVVSQKGSKGYI